ncbi:FAD-dependent oxidoreductase [Streptomyces sp. WI04-05B]|uniref:FAD-dependent oxidoreductase n=1 Tax=Streptomyces TaxID=1883 RepID=UPI0029BAFF82|nr:MULTISPECIES: FAD-dependent monooxygenase [unclassified Streptomyces]MDX2542455.1 FAD-dependent monooxygenase [Streptomyces sp. WI04-05B]MDX2582526.1 FAD-dependent monooxygenase [Streptomyces sp. WI04-05A]
MKNYDVVVIGGGPTGLVLAGLLSRAGVRVFVAERRLHRGDRPKAVVLHAPTLELLDSFGLLGDVYARSIPLERFTFRVSGAGTYSAEMTGMDTFLDGYRNMPQPILEGLLEKYALEFGAQTEHGVSYLSHEATDSGVTVRFEGHEDIHCSYLIGSDGPRSAVRESLGISMTGRSLTSSYLLVEGVQRELVGRDEVGIYVGEAGMVTMMPIPGDQVLVAGPAVSGLVLERGVDIPWCRIAEAIETLGFGSRLRLADAVRTSQYSVDLRIADRLVAGNVVLAGDAAHLNTPAGGQGLNLGIGDAFALSWRILLALNNGDSSILSGYDEERRSYAEKVVKTTFLAPFIERIRTTDETTGPAVRQELDALALSWSQLYPGDENWNGAHYELTAGARVPTALRTTGGPVPFLPLSDRVDGSTLVLFDDDNEFDGDFGNDFDDAAAETLAAEPSIPPVRAVHRLPRPAHGRVTAPANARGLLVRPDRRVARVLGAQPPKAPTAPAASPSDQARPDAHPSTTQKKWDPR